ncbi:MAG: hypothetical protein ACRC4G_06610, partial [Alphaproteobacteria bacterium]
VCYINGDGIETLGRVLPQSKIKRLNVGQNLIDGLAIYKFVTETLSQSQLINLDCSANQLPLFSKRQLREKTHIYKCKWGNR